MADPQHVPGTFSWFECGSSDAAASKSFYTRLFGWTAEDKPMAGDMGGHYTMFKLGGEDVAGLYELAGPMAGAPPCWATYVTVANVDETVSQAESLGGKAGAPAMDVPGVGRIAFVQDPTGAMIALFQPGEHRGAGTQGKMPGAFCWSELSTGDTATAGKFYSQLFDWSMKTDASATPYTEFQIGGKSVAGMMELTPRHGDIPPNWLPYVTVADCEASAARVTELGGKVVVPPTEVPEVGTFAVFCDPGGAALAIIQFADGPS
jgi:predicted enzyme related to lactoylglutathione lyase